MQWSLLCLSKKCNLRSSYAAVMAVLKLPYAVLVLLLLQQESLDAQQFQGHEIVRRATTREFVIDIIVESSVSIQSVLRLLNNFTINVNNDTLQITSLSATTECLPNKNGTQCRCEEGYSFSSETCVSYGACDASISGRCGCISGIPTDGEYCQLTNRTVTTMAPTTSEKTTNPTTTSAMTPTESKITKKVETTPTESNFTSTFTIDLPFQESFNVPTSPLYRNIIGIIRGSFEASFPDSEVTSLQFSSGSTIVDYTVKATFPSGTEVDTSGLLGEIRSVYNVIVDSENTLVSEPAEVFFGKEVTLSCGPPDFTNWTAEWRVDNTVIREDDQHRFTIEDGVAKLKILKMFLTDNGLYECRLKSTDNIIFRERFNEPFNFKPEPLVKVVPINGQVNCEDGDRDVRLRCSVQEPYKVRFKNLNETEAQEIDRPYRMDCSTPINTFTCEVASYPQYKADITMKVTDASFTCVDDEFGNGLLNDEGRASCEEDEEGEKTAICNSNGRWGNRSDTCVLKVILELLEQSKHLNNHTLPAFLEVVRENIEELENDVAESPNNLNATVFIFNNIANLMSPAISLNAASFTDFLRTASVLTSDKTERSWDNLNRKAVLSKTREIVKPSNESTSSVFLFSIERISTGLISGSFNISTKNIFLQRTNFANTFSSEYNSSVEVDVQDSSGQTNDLTVITFFSMENALPPRDEENSSLTVINGNVVIVQSSGDVDNVSLTYDVRNASLGHPQCVFWNFSLYEGLGGWDGEGCQLVSAVNDTVTCTCNHLTTFSMLMSPEAPEDLFLAIMTYIGVGISIACLLICLIIEAYTWRRMKLKDLAYLRHICIVNIAVSLLVADIWFIIGGAVSDAEVTSEGTCSAVTFFIHFFYLALFFWMLLFGILLLKSMVSVFNTGSSKRSKVAVGFSLGYGAPLLIAVITIAVTAPDQQYLAGPTLCWLNFYQSKALLAFVVPALTIVAINLVILIYVLIKMLMGRRQELGNARSQQQSDIAVIVRTVAILSPFFGLTWSLGVGTMVAPNNRGLHISFAFFNSLQGFFILVFGTLWDKKVRKELVSRTSTNSTRNTTSGTSSSGLLDRLRRGGRGYNVYTSNSASNI